MVQSSDGALHKLRAIVALRAKSRQMGKTTWLALMLLTGKVSRKRLRNKAIAGKPTFETSLLKINLAVKLNHQESPAHRAGVGVVVSCHSA